jgi:hypothetical protein
MTIVDPSELVFFTAIPKEIAKLTAANDRLSKELSISENRTQFLKGACGCLAIVTVVVIGFAVYSNYKTKEYEKQGTTKEKS